MHPRTLFRLITTVQNTLLAVSIFMMIALPIYIAFAGEQFSNETRTTLYTISLLTVTLVMIVRPLANLFPHLRWLAQLVILRKGFGVFSAAIIASFMFADIIVDGGTYFTRFFTLAYWSLDHYALLAHLGDITAIILLLTSNNYSKRLLGGTLWKKVQKTAYIYFYAGALYEFLALGDMIALGALLIVTNFVFLAYIKNNHMKPTVA